MWNVNNLGSVSLIYLEIVVVIADCWKLGSVDGNQFTHKCIVSVVLYTMGHFIQKTLIHERNNFANKTCINKI